MKLEKAIAASSDENLPTKKLKVDHNNTRVSARFYLLKSCLEMERSLRVYNTLNPQPEFPSDEDWKSCVDFEAVLNITRGLTTVSQYEKKFIAAMIIVVKIQTYQKN